MQMLLAAMLIDALHAALEDRKEAFNRVGVDDAASVFFRGGLTGEANSSQRALYPFAGTSSSQVICATNTGFPTNFGFF